MATVANVPNDPGYVGLAVAGLSVCLSFCVCVCVCVWCLCLCLCLYLYLYLYVSAWV